jgi:C1A family cysteine protease
MGWIPDVPSALDYTPEHPDVNDILKKTRLAKGPGAPIGARSSGAAAKPAVATEVDLRPYYANIEIEDQEQLGSCTANAAVGLIEYYQERAFGRHSEMSRLFIYKVTRNLMGVTGDTGAYLRTTMQTLACFGAPPESYWPYDGRPEEQNTTFEKEPTSFCYAFAGNFQSLKYYRLDAEGVSGDDTLKVIKTYLAKEFPCMFGFSVHEEFMSPKPGGLVPFPKPKSKFYGGHAIIAVGYDDGIQLGPNDKGALLIRNSWGTGWGDGGYAWLSYKYVTKRLADDFWSVISQQMVDTGVFN